MDPVELEKVGQALYHLIDAEDKRKLILDFEKVEYISSQAIGIVLTLNKKLSALPHSKFVLCGVGPKLMELLKITRLDKILTVKKTQREAVKVFHLILCRPACDRNNHESGIRLRQRFDRARRDCIYHAI